ncbi:MAG: efflux RND transporter periplasmic adaptor subunit [Hydrogenophaga sp.]|uniref:efflux RND transporter periplasmic adaptor subunit n=1 Tax=Hydrogenophaga sp. TaxID=1904254 RepID=UPI002631624D|nr:efflux RND transporter periplasmic adaptor subunit [Hydrogenophaga sp.]MCW5668290.1 efflux RND transporter periplasmic adaptor subunit [Hydrogenophaga sp.]
MSKLRLALYGAAGLAVLAVLGWALAPRPVEVEAAPVARGHFEHAIEEDGRTRLRDRYVVSAPVAAHLSRVTLREGDRVQAGDTVAVLTPVMPSLYDERSLREATARARAAEAAVAGAQARVERALVAQDEARLELQRTEKLARDGFIAASRLDSARLALDGARREREAAQAARDVAAHELEQAQASVRPASAGAPAGRPLAVRAPVSGVVLRVPLPSENTVAAGAALIDIGDPSQMEVVAELLTTDAVQAKPGTRVSIERWGGPPVQAQVRRVEPAAFTKVSALGIEEQRVKVLIDITDPPAPWLALGDGFRVTVRVITVSTDDAVMVPVGALFPRTDADMAVYVLDGGRARLRTVQIVARNGSMAWVRAGLEPGERVIVYPPPGVADGRRVRVLAP